MFEGGAKAADARKSGTRVVVFGVIGILAILTITAIFLFLKLVINFTVTLYHISLFKYN